MIGFIQPILGYIFLVAFAIMLADIIATKKGYKINLAFPIKFQHKQGGKREIITSSEVGLDKKGLVIEAIIEDKEITPKDKDVTVYITKANGLNQMFSQELKDISDKLQDEKKLKLETFPKWLLPESRLTHESFDARVQVMLDPSKDHFTVRLLKDLSEPDKEGSQN